MSSRDLIEAARLLAEPGPGRPTQARLRRAVSTACYAMFHCLAATVADLFIGRFEQVDFAARRGFAAHALFRQRPW